MYNGKKDDRLTIERRRMVRCDLKGRDITDPGVLKVMGEIRREDFMLGSYRSKAYVDGPVPIGMGQTISQPYIVALMTQELRLNSHCEVLEIGTGSGYQTAVLSKLAKEVYTIERFNQLSESAQAVLGKSGDDNIKFYIGDGSCGWPEQRTFDRIIVTAAVPQVPMPLTVQLVEAGLIVAPVGHGDVQRLVVGEKKKGELVFRPICDVRFVKLIGEHAFEAQ
ncbi:MAG: protein-L-isoaspartate(D-aspartate) O-methyltransferase [Sedimentisphaerales bacterium]|nr:protein-L-isoaspartate(D-aspartate) O-methyltransferase [Sedimentisphaerales bacterium]